MKAKQFKILRTIFGLYLFVDLFLILLDSNYLLTPGLLVTDFSSFRDHIFKFTVFQYGNPFNINQIIICSGMILAISLALGRFRRQCALMLWIVYLSLFNFLPNMKMTPSPEMIGITLFFMIFIPKGENDSRDWELPSVYFLAFNIILGLTYLSSGLHKATSVVWQDGTAMSYIFQMPLGRDFFFTQFLLGFPVFLKGLTWLALIVEIIPPIFLFFKTTRAYGWWIILSLQLISLVILDIPMINIAMIIFQLFSFDMKYISALKKPMISRC